MSRAAPTASKLHTFDALKNPQFRVLWLALLLSAVGTWMQIVTLSLLVLRLTDNSSTALGFVSLAQALTFIGCSLFGGSLADRFDKRKLLLFTQTLLAITAALLGFLTLTQHIALWSIIVLSVVSSAVLSIDQPTRGALVPLLVPKELLTNAVALQAVAFSSAAAIGPALAGFLSGPLGLGGIFLLNAASFAGMLIALWRIQLSGRAAVRGGEGKPDFRKSLTEALEVIKQDTFLPWIISGYGAVLFFGPSVSLILPIFAQRQLHLSHVGLGWLFTAVGLGTVVGGLAVASFRKLKQQGRVFLGATAVWVVSLIAFGFTHTLAMAMAALFVQGLALNVVQSVAISVMQGRVEERLRGRIMSVNTLLMMGVRPLGDFPAGALAGVIGPGGVVWVGAGIVGLLTAWLGTRSKLPEL
ncbi:MFS transporter [Deinococcus alpinitundrae]|uniref:MFS transporter n=1 Tax=Deinococcus alpinitundrae TaxID=468913 RepID=UPI00137A8341|nr:MFS transporter [Deinococcus alpinitundrae]